MSESIKTALAGCGSHAEIRRHTNYKRRVSVLSGRLVGNMTSKSAGASARVYRGGVWGLASIGSTDEGAIANGSDSLGNHDFADGLACFHPRGS